MKDPIVSWKFDDDGAILLEVSLWRLVLLLVYQGLLSRGTIIPGAKLYLNDELVEEPEWLEKGEAIDLFRK